MPDTVARALLEAMADEIFELSKLSSAARTRAGPTPDEVSEAEFLALDALIKRGAPMTVGELQKALGVLPAQMSRLIRALEEADGPLVECAINRQDKRRIDVTPTAAGIQAHLSFRQARTRMTVEILARLSPEDREHFMRILGQIREIVAERGEQTVGGPE